MFPMRRTRIPRLPGRIARAPPATRHAALLRPSFPILQNQHVRPPVRTIEALATLHTSAHPRRRVKAHNNEEVPTEAPTTDFSRMDILGTVPPPSTSVDVCMSDGFQLNSGAQILDGSGVLLVGGEAFAWRPWGRGLRLVNQKGQWEVERGAWGVLSLVWPRPDLLILGLGPEMRPLSPETKRYIGSLGMRVEVLDTRNAASQFNMLATERGVSDVAACLIPIGWREGYGAG